MLFKVYYYKTETQEFLTDRKVGRNNTQEEGVGFKNFFLLGRGVPGAGIS